MPPLPTYQQSQASQTPVAPVAAPTITPPVATPAPAPVIPLAPTVSPSGYSFDANKYLPQIQQTAASIYDPQQAQIEALSQLGTSQAEQSRVRTKEQFAKTLAAEIESINQRGAFFGGGALNRESDVRQQENYALTDIGLQEQAQQAGFLAQKAGLSASQAEYIQNKLSGAENSAYSRFIDERSYQFQQDEFEYRKKRDKAEDNARKKAAKSAKKAGKASSEWDAYTWQQEYDQKERAANKPKSSPTNRGYKTVTKKDPITGTTTTERIYN